MKRPPGDSSAVLLVVLGVVGLLVYRARTGTQGAGGSFLDSIFGPSSGGAALTAKDPYTAAIQALTPTIGKISESLFTDGSDLRNRLRQHGDAYQNIAAHTPFGKLLGIKKPGESKKKRQQFWNAEFAARQDAERFASKVHGFLARTDVEQWQLDPDLNFWIFYRGVKTPYKLATPTQGVGGRLEPRDRQAYAAEPIVRALGAFAQAGRRFAKPFVRHDPPAYSDENTFANQDQTVSGVKRRDESPLSQIQKAKQIQDRIGSRKGINFVQTPQPQPTEESAA